MSQDGNAAPQPAQTENQAQILLTTPTTLSQKRLKNFSKLNVFKIETKTLNSKKTPKKLLLTTSSLLSLMPIQALEVFHLL